ncbi:MAG TPA: VWA domain-containing protein, partial [Actinomycetota bacterium]|nr:VWA domain-containing protein [Actinomycetota bacterium]
PPPPPPPDFDLYDEVFDSFFAGELEPSPAPGTDDAARPPAPVEEGEPEELPLELMAGSADDDAGGEGEEQAAVRLVSSPTEVLRSRSFEHLSAEERALVATLIRRLSVRLPQRSGRRLRRAPKKGAFDMRRTLRASLRTEGEPFRRAWRRRAPVTRPLVLMLDVSGSMSAYARALVQFGFAALATGHRVEVFCFGTRLTRVSRQLRARDPDRALEAIATAVRDWEGGTRIGDSLKELLDGYGGHASIRGSVFVLCSDGLERGDPVVLEHEMARLGRLARRVVWVNPLKGDPLYEPLARGMAAALPHVDVFLPGHNLASLETLGRVLAEG